LNGDASRRYFNRVLVPELPWRHRDEQKKLSSQIAPQAQQPNGRDYSPSPPLAVVADPTTALREETSVSWGDKLL
jgi:hypothetical protein